MRFYLCATVCCGMLRGCVRVGGNERKAAGERKSIRRTGRNNEERGIRSDFARTARRS
jgi:hypothetical protein